MISNDVVVPQPLAVAVSAVTPLVATFADMMDGELGVRLGQSDGAGQWETGVSEPSFNEILSMFLKYEAWDEASPGWVDIHDYLYTLGDGTRMRTSVELTTRLTLTHIIKHHVNKVELRMRNHGRARVSLKKEIDVNGKMLPETVSPHTVRIMKRRSFTHGAWRFELTRVWRGSSRSSAEEAQERNQCAYEVEVAFVSTEGYWENPRHTPTYVSTSLLMKMVDVLSDEMIGCEVVG